MRIELHGKEHMQLTEEEFVCAIPKPLQSDHLRLQILVASPGSAAVDGAVQLSPTDELQAADGTGLTVWRRATEALLSTVLGQHHAEGQALLGSRRQAVGEAYDTSTSPLWIVELGAGVGVAGLALSKLGVAEKLWITDSDPLAVAICKLNAKRNFKSSTDVTKEDSFAHLASSLFISEGNLIAADSVEPQTFHVAPVSGGRGTMVTVSIVAFSEDFAAENFEWCRAPRLLVLGSDIIFTVRGAAALAHTLRRVAAYRRVYFQRCHPAVDEALRTVHSPLDKAEDQKWNFLCVFSHQHRLSISLDKSCNPPRVVRDETDSAFDRFVGEVVVSEEHEQQHHRLAVRVVETHRPPKHVGGAECLEEEPRQLRGESEKCVVVIVGREGVVNDIASQLDG